VTILIVMLMAILRQSFLALGYVLILLPRIKDGAEVLKQSIVHQGKRNASTKSKIEALEQEIEEIEAKMEKQQKEEQDLDKPPADLQDKRAYLLRLKVAFSKEQKQQSMKTFEEKREEKAQKAE
jgi:Tfp pilus assembly protein PilN